AARDEDADSHGKDDFGGESIKNVEQKNRECRISKLSRYSIMVVVKCSISNAQCSIFNNGLETL
ncbi:MAG TPA: hypothetical protein VHM26_00245, partial [Chitinophagaceae bacterium]|nr:hypothetical protein [Chitinophagaceae bacterium]